MQRLSVADLAQRRPASRWSRLYLDILNEVKANVTIPVAMKLSPFFSAIPNMAHKLDAAGADALVLFNRFYQPDFDLEELDGGAQPGAQPVVGDAPAAALDRHPLRPRATARWR